MVLMLQERINKIKNELTNKEWDEVIQFSLALQSAFIDLVKLNKLMKSQWIIYKNINYNLSEIFEGIINTRTSYLEHWKIYNDLTLTNKGEEVLNIEAKNIFKKVQKKILKSYFNNIEELEDYLCEYTELIVAGEEARIDVGLLPKFLTTYNMALEENLNYRRETNRENNFILFAYKALHSKARN